MLRWRARAVGGEENDVTYGTAVDRAAAVLDVVELGVGPSGPGTARLGAHRACCRPNNV
ncbi:hypothetical protein [Nocardia jinanensis]|nr:hypothetical protein [Nocardia jinanensis]